MPPYIGSMPRGGSSTASFNEQQYGDGLLRLQKSYVLGQFAKGSFSELIRMYEECGQRDWDGYGASPVSVDAFASAVRFLQALPLGTPAPSIGAEPDGHITLEWYKSPHRALSVSVSPEGLLHFAAMIGASRQYGSEPFYGEMPQTILASLNRVLAV